MSVAVGGVVCECPTVAAIADPADSSAGRPLVQVAGLVKEFRRPRRSPGRLGAVSPGSSRRMGALLYVAAVKLFHQQMRSFASPGH